MTTDITELAQRMKAAAMRAKAATEDYVAHRMSITVYLEECKEFNDLSDGPDNILALVEALEKARKRINQLESRTVTVKLPEGDEHDDLVTSITEEIAHLQRCVERYRKEEMVSTTQEMEQRLLVQQIALSVLNNAAGIKWEGE